MTTEIIKINPDNPQPEIIKKAADYIRLGKLVAIPTETVYGLAADINNKDALERLYAVKSRPSDKPFTVGIARRESLELLAQEIVPFVYRLIDKFWPGPLTLVLKSKKLLVNEVPDLSGINGESEQSIGLRMPDNKIALEIISSSGVNVALPSANISNRQPPRSAQEVLKDLRGVIDLVLDAGKTELGIESTVVDVRAAIPKIIREGAVGKDEIEKIAKKKRVLFVCTGNSCRSVMAQGLLEKALKVRNRGDVEVFSSGIGVFGGLGPTQETLDLLRSEGIDMSGHRSCRVSELLLKSSDLILVMEDVQERRILELERSVRNRLYLLKEFVKIVNGNLNIDDPIGQGINCYQRVFNTIKECINKIVTLL